MTCKNKYRYSNKKNKKQNKKCKIYINSIMINTKIIKKL